MQRATASSARHAGVVLLLALVPTAATTTTATTRPLQRRDYYSSTPTSALCSMLQRFPDTLSCVSGLFAFSQVGSGAVSDLRLTGRIWRL